VIVPSADLGGLGAKTGPAEVFHWVIPSIIPSLTPWLAVLLLLLAKPNRCPQAWLIWVPLGFLAALATVLTRAMGWLPAPLNQVFSDLVLLLGFGAAATWLLATYLGLKHRALTFLGILLVAAGFSFFAFLFFQDWTANDSAVWGVGMIGGLGALVISLALSLAGWLCRKRFRPVRLSLLSLVFMLGLWTLISTPFVVIVFFSPNGGSGWVENLLLPLCGITGVTFVALAPFLLLSFWNGFYRARLKSLLKLGIESAVPPVIRRPVEALVGAAP